VVLFLLQLLMWSNHFNGPPPGVVLVGQRFDLYGAPAIAAGGLLFWLAGLLWGALYGAILPRHTSLSGLLFSLAPTIFALTLLPPLLDKPIFAGGDLKGISIQLLLNALWGVLVGFLTPTIQAARVAASTRQGTSRGNPKGHKRSVEEKRRT
jgi:hypothetical protein